MRKRRMMSEINVVPYIDVMLVLLVIFMVTAPLIQTSSVNLPSISNATPPPVAPLEIVVKVGQLMLLDRAQNANVATPVNSLSDLIARIKTAKAKNPDQAVLIAGDKMMPYGEVLKVMDELQRQNINKIGLLVKPTTTTATSP